MATADESLSTKRWLPLEANSDVMNQFLCGLGLLPDEAEYFDVYGFDDELLEMVPKPVLAVLFLFPITPQSEEERIQQESNMKEPSSNVYFMKQIVGNACGTIALLHALGNIRSRINLTNGSYFDRFFKSTSNKDPFQHFLRTTGIRKLPTAGETEDASTIIKGMIKKNSDRLNFNVIAISNKGIRDA